MSAMDKISYADLYARWERGNWRATEIDFSRRPGAVARGLQRARAQGRAVELLDVLPRRGRRRRRPRAVHRRRPARGAEVLPRHPAGRRGAPLGLLPPLHARGRRARRRHHRRRAGRDRARADLGLPQDLRDARRGHRRPAQGPLAHRARARGDHVPLHRRGDAGPARPALHRRLPRAPRPAARLPRGHGPRRPGRAAPHRLRRQAPARPRQGGPGRGPRRGRGPAARGLPHLGRRVRAAGLEPRVHRVLRLHARGDLHRGRALVRVQAADGRPAARVAARAADLPLRPAGRGARHARAGDAARRLPGREERRRRARPRVDGAAVRLRAPRGRPAHRARGAR